VGELVSDEVVGVVALVSGSVVFFWQRDIKLLVTLAVVLARLKAVSVLLLVLIRVWVQVLVS
jgi:hypothetical protein